MKAEERALLGRYAAIGLAITGALEWLLGRTVSRLAAAPPLEGTARTIVEALGRFGIFLISPAFVLAAALLILSLTAFGAKAHRERDAGGVLLSIYLSIFATLAIVHALAYALQLIPAGSSLDISLTITLNLVSLGALWWLALRFSLKRRVGVGVAARLSVVLIALAYSGWYYYVLEQSLENFGLIEGAAPVLARDIGEGIATLCSFVLFMAIAVPGRQWAHWRRWILPALLALALAGGSIADMAQNTGFVAVFSAWSVGFDLFLPWPLYAIALALFIYSLLTCFARDSVRGAFANADVGLGLLLLPFAGYYLQLSYQHLVAVLSLALLTGLTCPLSEGSAEEAEVAERYHLKSSTSS